MKKVINEIKNVTWASKKSVVSNTVLIIFATVILGGYIYGVDSLTNFLTQIVVNKL